MSGSIFLIDALGVTFIYSYDLFANHGVVILLPLAS